ncbi:PREDICTED: putative F-box/kelch-repeat protein At4g35120 [Camelina sativa]|uniref:F-box/kelch-repeat protein At4g35120 n=1 Tax=Camelina sativa TaxID=90675 RepID=A0ABM0V5G0_CAMSA|nr:PREDICTED: putative F-box/kelch-repeat protein At4g35120 [Camelina sativa]
MTNRKALPPSSPLFSSLPDEVIVDCLARVSKSDYRSICLVSKSFYSLLSSQEIYAARSHIGTTEPRLYVCLYLHNKHRWFTLAEIKNKVGLVPVRLSSSDPPALLNSTTVAVGSEIYKIGGTVNGKGSRAVFVLDCKTHTWRCAPKMRVSRVGAKSCFLDGKIYVIGGCMKKEEKFKKWGEVFDIKTQTWKPLRRPSDDALGSNLKVAVFGERLYVITKYNSYAYDPEKGRWLSEVGFEDLQPIIGTQSGGIEKVMEDITTGPWCVVGNVMFSVVNRKYKWFCSRSGKWLVVEGLDGLCEKRGLEYRCYCTIQLVNYGGKLLIIWQKPALSLPIEYNIWCAVIRLEERMSPQFGPQILGEVERQSVIVARGPMSYKLSNCQCVSV